jgi:uncharacterized spore protein YtfJ
VREIRLPKVETEIKAGERIEIEGRDIYPVVKVSTLKTPEGIVFGSWITPLAMLVIEQKEQYAVSFTGEKMTADQIVELAPTLKKVIDKARGTCTNIDAHIGDRR